MRPQRQTLDPAKLWTAAHSVAYIQHMSKGSFASAAGVTVGRRQPHRPRARRRHRSTVWSRPDRSIYKMAFRPADLLYYIVAGALYSAFIPVLPDLRTDREEEAWKVFSVVTSVMGMVVLVLILIGEIFTRQLVPLVAWGFDAGELDMMASLTRILLPAQFFFFIGGLTMGTLQARGVFAIPRGRPSTTWASLGQVLPSVRNGLCIGALAGRSSETSCCRCLLGAHCSIPLRST